MRAHGESAKAVAEALEGSAGVRTVLYPGLPSHPQHDLACRQMRGFGTMVAFELAGGKAAAYRLLDRLELVDISNNLGDAKSLICHPWTTTHQRMAAEDKLAMGIGAGMLRLSVGLEDAEDLVEDLAQALDG